eukprot:1159183-Pelagomonas_calceolata.AAC.4
MEGRQPSSPLPRLLREGGQSDGGREGGKRQLCAKYGWHGRKKASLPPHLPTDVLACITEQGSPPTCMAFPYFIIIHLMLGHEGLHEGLKRRALACKSNFMETQCTHPLVMLGILSRLAPPQHQVPNITLLIAMVDTSSKKLKVPSNLPCMQAI